MNLSDNPVPPRLEPAEAARRALKLLAERRTIPTPESFADAFREVGGESGRDGPGGLMRAVLRDLVTHDRLAAGEATHLLAAVRSGDWAAVRVGVERALVRPPAAAGGGLAPGAAGAAPGAPGAAPGPTGAAPGAAGAAPAAGTAAPGATAGPPDSAARRYGHDPADLAALAGARGERDAWRQLSRRSLRLIEGGCAPGSAAQRKVAEYQAAAFGADGRDLAAAAPRIPTDRLVARFTDVAAAVERQAGDDQRVRAGLQRLLGLLCDNVGTLAPDEVWLAGQLEPIRELLAGPVQAAQLLEAETRLAQVIGRQFGARRGLQEAKVAMRELIGALVERVGTADSSAGRYYERIGAWQQELERADGFDGLSRVVQGLLADTQQAREEMRVSHEDLLAARRQVDAQEQRVRDLERELSEVSTLVHKDPLTHALNRRGLEEAFRVETARATRHRTPLTVLLVDVDDFKVVNDTYGHAAGDRALVHLIATLQAVLRPTDVLARTGGEEFVALFPATSRTQALALVTRLQRELARRPFVAEGQPRALTLSGGLAVWQDGETLEAISERADAALYAAKRAGKNRVLEAG